MSDDQDYTCPFCKENGFDMIGLKIHLIRWCGEFNELDIAPKRVAKKEEDHEND